MTSTELRDITEAVLALVDDGVFVLSAAVTFAVENDEDLDGPADERKITTEVIRQIAAILPDVTDSEYQRLLRVLADQEAGIDYSFAQ